MESIAVLLIIIIGILIYLTFKSSTILDFCTTIKRNIVSLENKVDLNDMILKNKYNQQLLYQNEIEKIVFSNEESQVKVRKLIELSQKRNNS